MHDPSPRDPTRDLWAQVSPNATTDLRQLGNAPQVPGNPESGAALPSTETAVREAPKSCRLEPLSADRYGVHFTAEGEFRDLLERVRGLAGHRLPSGDLKTLMKRGLEAYERELEKEPFALGRKPRRKRSMSRTASTLSASESEASKTEAPKTEAPKTETSRDAAMMNTRPSVPAADGSALSLAVGEPTNEPKFWPIPTYGQKQHCPAEVVREVFIRDGKRCTYLSPDGRRCSARRCLELDHIDPRAEGGPDTVRNLRLRCRAHPPSGITKRVNQWYARQYFGRAHVAAAVKRSRLARTARRSDRVV